MPQDRTGSDVRYRLGTAGCLGDIDGAVLVIDQYYQDTCNLAYFGAYCRLETTLADAVRNGWPGHLVLYTALPESISHAIRLLKGVSRKEQPKLSILCPSEESGVMMRILDELRIPDVTLT